MCNCKNIEIGSLSNTILLELPWRKDDYRNIDICLMSEIVGLWSVGIKTCGCCCGHNISQGEIFVKDEYIQRMKDMNYIAMESSFPGGGTPLFFPKSVEIIPIETEIQFFESINYKYIDGYIRNRIKISHLKNEKRYIDIYKNIENL